MGGKDAVIPVEDDADALDVLISKYQQLFTEKTERPQTEKPKFPKVSKLMPPHIKEYEKFCVPKLISFGPYHYGNPRLKRGETLKLKYSGFYIRFYHQFHGDQKPDTVNETVKELYSEILGNIAGIRQCYDEESTHKYGDHALARMMLVDACALLFLVIHVFTYYLYDEFVHDLSYEDLASVQQDVMLLENQLPFELLISKLLKKWVVSGFPFFDIWMRMFQEFADMSNMESLILHQNSSCFPIKQIFCRRQSEQPLQQLVDNLKPCHLLDLFRENMLGNQPSGPTVDSKSNPLEDLAALPIRNVTELMAVGIRIELNRTGYLTDVSFTSYGSIAFLRLPPITIDKSTHTRFLNLIAYEMCSCDTHHFISYLRFLDSLIDHADDVEGLQSAGILQNNLGTHQQVADFFNNVSANFEPNFVAYKNVRIQISEYLQKHRQSKMRRWMTQFLDKYFSSPWAIIALVAAFLALLLTAVQTYLAFFPRSST